MEKRVVMERDLRLMLNGTNNILVRTRVPFSAVSDLQTGFNAKIVFIRRKNGLYKPARPRVTLTDDIYMVIDYDEKLLHAFLVKRHEYEEENRVKERTTVMLVATGEKQSLGDYLS
jgi:hypothetical protein